MGEDDAVCVDIWLDGVVDTIGVCVSKTEILRGLGLLIWNDVS